MEAVILVYLPKIRNCRFEECKRQYLREKEKIAILSALNEIAKRMSNPLEISVTQQWEKQDPDMSTCKACKQVIYGTQYELSIMVCGEKVEQDHPVKLCEPCYSKRNDT